jgi:cell division protein FtsW (lipid II flippase)
MIKNLIDSLKNKGEFSGRKLSAFVGFLTAIYLTIFKIPLENQLDALMVWLSFSLLCLGIVTVQNVIEFKNGKKD